MIFNDAIAGLFRQAGARFALVSRHDFTMAYSKFIINIQDALLSAAITTQRTDADLARRLTDVARSMSIGGPNTPVDSHTDLDLPLRVNTGLGAGVDQVITQSPSLLRLVEETKDDGWGFGYNTKPTSEIVRDPPAGYRSRKMILLNAAVEGHAAVTVGHLATLIGRAQHPAEHIPPVGISKERFVVRARDAEMVPHVHGVLTNVVARREILASGLDIDIGTPFAHADFYQRAAANTTLDSPNQNVLNRIQLRFEQEQAPDGTTYDEYYRRHFTGQWLDYNDPT